MEKVVFLNHKKKLWEVVGIVDIFNIITTIISMINAVIAALSYYKK